MKKLIVMGAALAALAACSTEKRLLAPDHGPELVSPETPKAVAHLGVDPVCGAKMKHAEMFWHLEYCGNVYYFDTPRCREVFEESPEAFSITAR